MMRATAYIPTRAHSTRLPNKNLRTVGGVPLVVRAAMVAAEARSLGLLSHIVVDYEDQVAAAAITARRIDITPRWRPADMREPGTRVVDLVRDWLRSTDAMDRPDLVCVLIPTSPLRTIRHLVESRLCLDAAADGVMSVTPFRQDVAYALCESDGFVRLRFDPQQVGPSFVSDVTHDGTVVWARTIALLALRPEDNFYGLRLRPYLVPPEEAVDVNTESDLTLAEAMLEKRRATKVEP